jgi:hypothetical protein
MKEKRDFEAERVELKNMLDGKISTREQWSPNSIFILQRWSMEGACQRRHSTHQLNAETRFLFSPARLVDLNVVKLTQLAATCDDNETLS